MDSLVVLAIQCTFSCVIFFLLAKWYVEPLITKQSKNKILALLLIINVFRYLPLSLYMPGQVSESFPENIKDIIAHGDFISSILAFIALLSLKANSKFSTGLIWFFTIASITDMVLALSFAMNAKVYQLALGLNYFTVSVYVPMLMVVQYQIVKILTTKNLK
jgi:hypothetical protein